jgi:hypothetical protein
MAKSTKSGKGSKSTPQAVAIITPPQSIHIKNSKQFSGTFTSIVKQNKDERG